MSPGDRDPTMRGSNMRGEGAPIVKDLVLVGGGHSHVAVLKRFGMEPLPGVRLTLICPVVDTPYSGMLPGLVAGHYTFDQVHIDLGRLADFAGARFYRDAAVGLDLDRRRVHCRDRPPVAFDVLSLNVGSSPNLEDLISGTGGDGAGEVIPVKPISRFLERWEALRERVLGASGRLSIGVVGAGAGGVELTLAAQHALREELAGPGRHGEEPDFHLFSATGEILPGHNRGVRRRYRRVLGKRGVTVHALFRVTAAEGGAVRSETGETVAVDEVLWVTEAGAAGWLGEAGLALDEEGFVEVAETLESTSHRGVFAAGDVAAVVDHPRPKAGVFAVRQGPVLADNLRRALLGRRLRRYRPQKKFLSLISTGDRHAVASRGSWSLEGRWVWRWKDWIDRRFMARYQDLPEMAAGEARALPEGLVPEAERRALTESPAGGPAMRCAGCGSKVGATVLGRVLGRLDPAAREDLLVGLAAPDDAAVVRVPPGRVLVESVDFFPALIDDPYRFGKIAAHHGLSDLYAMAAEPQSALAIAVLPQAAEEKLESTLEELLRGAIEVLEEADAALVGGHTTEGAELAFGLALQGTADPDRLLRKAGLQPGDRLVLTKPIGTGTLFAAAMRRRAKGRWIEAAIDSMLRSNRAAARCLLDHGATAATDVTGFGVAGHLVEMVEASAVDATVRLAALPLLDGALETAAAGDLSSLQPANERVRRAVETSAGAASDPRFKLLYDPQTSGGLLAGIPADRAEACVAELHRLGYADAAAIGEVAARSGRPEPVQAIT